MNKQILYDTFSTLHLDAMWRLFHKSPCVLFYHGVAGAPDPIIETESIAVSDFVSQIKYLKRNYHIITVSEFEERFTLNDWDGDEVLLTFDDGYKNILTTALPILEDFNVPFNIFLTSNNINDGNLFPTTVARLVILASSLQHLHLKSCGIDVPLTINNRRTVAASVSNELKTRSLSEVKSITNELLNSISEDELYFLRDKYFSINPLSWEEARMVANSSLCTVGSHCLDHICCHSKQNMQDVQIQLKESKEVIEKQLGVVCEYFAYPNGSFTTESNLILQNVGYKLGFSTRRLPINSLTKWNIPRLYVPYNYSRFVYYLVNYPKLIR